MLTSIQVADRLGVKLETVYAYVSRGLLERHQGLDGRSSLFRESDVERLARRGRPRRTTRSAAIDFSIRTQITSVEPARLSYRGHDARQLARTATFEQVAELLWTGALPAETPAWQPPDIGKFSVDTPTDRLRLAVIAAAARDPFRKDLSPAAVAGSARTLIAAAVASIPPAGDGRTPRLVLPTGGQPLRATMAGRLWAGLTPNPPRAGMTAVMNAALVLIADHELAASTFAARVAASTRADPYNVVLAGLGVLAGPLHGGAGHRVWQVLADAEGAGPAPAVAKALDLYGHHPGFGHPIYTDVDPRAAEILDLVRRAAGGSRQMALVDAVLSSVQQRAGLGANVDFGLAALAYVAGMSSDASEVIFTIGRIAGWVAHALEEYQEVPLRFRPRAVFEPPERDRP